MKVEIGRLIRYGIVGGFTACLYFSTVGVAMQLFEMSPVVASALGQIVAIAVAYYGHSLFSFQVRPDSSYFVRFMAIVATSLLLNISAIWFLTAEANVPYALAIVVVAILVPLYSYLCNRFWVFLPGLDQSNHFANPARKPEVDGIE